MNDASQQQALASLLMQESGYRAARVLPDGSVAALRDLLYTRAIMLGCNRDSYELRFCFEDRALADKRFAELHSEDDEPEGYVARRGMKKPT